MFKKTVRKFEVFYWRMIWHLGGFIKPLRSLYMAKIYKDLFAKNDDHW